MADRRIENSRLLRHRLVRGSVHYASTPTLVSVGLNDPDSNPYNSSSGNDDSALDSSDNNNDDIYHHTNSSSNSSDNSNGYSVGRHPSYEFANNNFNNLSHKPYFSSSSSSSTSSSRTFRKNNARPVSNIVGGNPNLVNSPVTINSTNVTHHIIHPDMIRQCQFNGNPDNRLTTSINGSNFIPNTNNSNLLNNPSQAHQHNAPGHVRFTSASTATSSVSSYSSSSNNVTTHPKSILRRKNLNSSSNVMTSSNNNNQTHAWDNIQARRSSCGALIQQSNEQQILESSYNENNGSNNGYQDPNLSVSSLDIAAIESTYKGHKTKVFVCQSLANLYTCPKISTMSNSVSNWVLTFTGVPVLLLDLGTTRSRTKRQIQLLLVEKGTCFTLWQDVVDNLTRYSSTNDGLFHTLHLSTDHSVRVGLSFDSKPAAQAFHDKVLQLTNDPENVALKGPRRNLGATKSHYYLDNLPNKSEKDQKKSNKMPNKMDISQPCGFQHVVSVSQNDFKKYFSLQTFVPSTNPDVNNKNVQNNMKNQQQSRVSTGNIKYATPSSIQPLALQQDQQTLPLPLLPSDSSNSPMSTSSSNSSTTSSTSGDYMQRRKKSPAPPPPVNFTNMRINTMNTKYQQSNKPISNMLTTQSRSCHDIYQL